MGMNTVLIFVPDTIRGWIKKGTIPHYKVGRQYKFKLSEVDAWIESGQSADADK